MSAQTAEWLHSIGYLRKGLDYPRWRSNIYAAQQTLHFWKYCKENYPWTLNKQSALHVIAMQTFTGIRPEWAEENIPWKLRDKGHGHD